MKNTLKILSWIEVVIGALAILGSLGEDGTTAGLLGGILFLACGWVALSYIAEHK